MQMKVDAFMDLNCPSVLVFAVKIKKKKKKHTQVNPISAEQPDLSLCKHVLMFLEGVLVFFVCVCGKADPSCGA